jgi:hypothetical protein
MLLTHFQRKDPKGANRKGRKIPYRTEKGWEPITTRDTPLVQFAVYGTALTEEQFNKMATKETVEKYQGEKKEKSNARQ